MPTGYTEIIEDNPDTTLRDYVLRCARAMGACIMQRDDPADVLPKMEKISTWHLDAMHKAQHDLIELESMGAKAIRALYESERQSNDKDNAEFLEKHERINDRYAKMRAKVVAWEPPTKNHEGLKRFMLEQIDICYWPDEKPYQCTIEPTPEEWHKARIERAKRDIDYHSQHWEDEQKRYKERAEWVRALYASFATETP